MANNLIALSTQPLQIESPIDQYGRAASTANHIQQSRLHAQQEQMNVEKLKAEQRSNQEASRALASQELVRQAWTQEGGHPDRTIETATKMGAGLPEVMAAQKHFGELRKQAAEIGKDELPVKEYSNGQSLAQTGTALNLPDDQYAQAYPQIKAKLLELNPKLQLPDQPIPKSALQILHTGFATEQQLLAEQKAKHDADAASAAAKKATHEQAMFLDEEGKVKSEAALKGEEVDTKKTQSAAETLASSKDQADYAAKLGALDPKTAAKFPPVFDKTKVLEIATTPEQRLVGQRAADVATEAHRHNLSVESTARYRTAIAAGRLAQEQMVNGMKYGPGTQEYWVKQLQDNPDSVKEMPPEFRSAVGKTFRETTGLPLPTPLTGATQIQETAARNALDGINFINKALANPEIKKNIGPIMGRLGNAEQRVGTAVGMSPEAEALAQELRTRMRYFVFQEGKAVLGGRLPQQLMKELEASSANVKMDPDMLKGALNGAEGNAHSVMDNADKQRFGGKMRTREMRGLPKANAISGAPAVGTIEDGHEFLGGDPSKPESWKKVK